MRAAVIGLGAMGKRHLAALARVPEIELAAVADANQEALDSVSLDEPVRRFRDAAVMLETARPELVIIATTAPSHRSLLEGAVSSGVRAILCEKPMACSLDDARGMIERCEGAGVALAVNHARRYVPAYAWLSEQIASGVWGSVRSLRAAVPGIGLGCLGTHFVDVLLFLAGTRLAEVSGWVDSPLGVNPRGAGFVDPGGTIVGVTGDNAKLLLQQIEDGAGPHHLAVDLTGARVMVDEWSRTVEILVRDRSVTPGPGRPPQYDRFELPVDRPLDLDLVGIITAILEELVTGERVTCGGADGYRALEAVVAAHLSHERKHVPIELPLTEPGALARCLPIT